MAASTVQLWVDHLAEKLDYSSVEHSVVSLGDAKAALTAAGTAALKDMLKVALMACQ